MKYALTPFLVLFLGANIAHAGDVSDTELTSYDEPSDNIVVIVDASGSMNDKLGKRRKMAAAKDALWKVLSRAPDNIHVGILVFPSGGWVYELGPREDEKLKRAIDAIDADGGTPLGEYMKKGTDALLKKRASQHGYGTYRLLIVTDGEAGDQDLVESYTPDIVSRGITVDVIGVGMKSDHTLATKVHAYRRANDEASLEIAVSETFAEVGNTSDGDAGENPYEVIDHLPKEVASGIIEALATSGNHPIGTKPPKVSADSTGNAGSSGGSKEKGGGGCDCEVSGSPGGSGTFLILLVGYMLFMNRSKKGAARERRKV